MFTLPKPREGEMIPLGLSLVCDSYIFPDKVTGFRLMLPFIPWHGTKYWFWDDSIVEGWWLPTVALAFTVTRSSFHLRIQWGSRPIGRNKHLQVDPR